jgi:hypothetical protein
VLHAITREDAPGAVVELDRDADDERALRIAEPFCDGGVDVRVGQRLLELRDRLVEERGFPLELLRLVRDVLHLGHRAQHSLGKISVRRTVPGAVPKGTPRP